MADNSRALESTASPEAVWKVWSDTSTWPQWNPDIEDVSLAAAFESGTTGTMRTRSGGRHNIVLSEVQPNRGFTLTSDLPMPATKARFRCEISPTAGGSRISQAVNITGLMSFMGGAITGRIVPSFEPLLEGLKKRVESGT